jgi:hypothetical protein
MLNPKGTGDTFLGRTLQLVVNSDPDPVNLRCSRPAAR